MSTNSFVGRGRTEVNPTELGQQAGVVSMSPAAAPLPWRWPLTQSHSPLALHSFAPTVACGNYSWSSNTEQTNIQILFPAWKRKSLSHLHTHRHRHTNIHTHQLRSHENLLRIMQNLRDLTETVPKTKPVFRVGLFLKHTDYLPECTTGTKKKRKKANDLFVAIICCLNLAG